MKKFNPLSISPRTLGHKLSFLLLTLSSLACMPAGAETTLDLADYPLFSTVSVPGNLALALSVEWPTATSPAYLNTTSYSSSSTYIGYFNPDLCYKYVYNSTTPSSSYFVPVSSASSHVCSGYWSGNFMNYSSMQIMDVFRSILTGGYRSTDTNTARNTTSINLDTILTKTYASSQGSYKSAPDKVISGNATTVAGSTPFSWSNITTRIHKLGRRMWFVGAAYSVCTDTSSSCPSNDLDSATSASAWNGGTSSSTVYEVYINVAVCVNASYKEDNCTQYDKAYKPEGLMQAYNKKLRYSVFGYLNRSYNSVGTATQLDGGVLRARMNYIGPTQPVPGSSDITNSKAPEWSSSTGIMYTNPVSSDAEETASAFGITMNASGSMNYINKFGNYTPDNNLSTSVYKSTDPVSELYYSVVRYYAGLGNVSEYTSGTTATYADGFPVITNWTSADSIVYSCQKNFILGIGDVNTHRDANLYGSTLRTYVEPTLPSAVSAYTDINVATATNMVGKLEGNSSLGSLYQYNASTTLGSSSSGDCSSVSSSTYKQCNTYYIAGLAYHIHTNDIRSTTSSNNTDTNMSGSQRVSTYWVDVMENQKYAHKNQYWLAAKYGGFTVPDSFSPYSSSNGTSTLADSTWYTNTDTNCGYSSTSTATFSTDSSSNKCSSSTKAGSSAYKDYRPDNYFFGNDGSTIKTGLTSAFAKISSELSEASSTTYSMITPNVTSGDAAYAATYDPTTWTSSLKATAVTYDSSGNATNSDTLWNARTLLESLSSPATSRYIVTYCDAASTPSGMAFTASKLASCTTDTASSASTRRLNYASFSSISNATSSSSTPQADYVSYLRGDRTNEISSSGTADSTRIYRYRKYLLGDIVNSKVTAVGAPSASFYDYYNPGYSNFKRAYLYRRTVVYAGANDGMLHAFDGTLPGYDTDDNDVKAYTSCSFCGKELFAYVPSFVYGTTSTAATSGLASLGNSSRTHYYMVDATPLSFDIDFDNVCNTGTSSSSEVCTKVNGTTGASSNSYNWKTVLIGGLGHGGKGFYAIDVTHPGLVKTTSSSSSKSCAHTLCRSLDTSDVTQTVSGKSSSVSYHFKYEAAVASKVLWEFPASSDTTTVARMGYSYGAPMVVKTKKYGWVAVFTSGYNNSDGKGYFFFVNPATGTLLETVATPTGSTSSPINLAQADAYISNMTDFTADAIYGGDNQGNLWRLDLTPTTTNYSAPTLMATLVNSSGKTQAVTTRPLIEIDSSTGKRYVLVGTGRLLADSDITSSTVQSIYSIYDGTSGQGNFLAASNFSMPLTYSDLNAITDLTAGISSSSSNNVNGWYYNLGVASSNSIAERMNVNPVAYSGVAAFGVNLPDGSICSPAGSGYVIAINIATGKTVLTDSDGNLVASSSTSGVITDLALQNVNGTVRLIVGDSKSNTVTVPTSLTTSSGLSRVNWRTVPVN